MPEMTEATVLAWRPSLTFGDGLTGEVDVLHNRKVLQLDFGTFLWPLTKAELLDLYAGPSTEASLRPGDGRQLHMLKALPEDGRFGLVVVEIY